MLVSPRPQSSVLPLVDADEQFDSGGDTAASLNAAFLIAASGAAHPRSPEAMSYLQSMADSERWGLVASFYRDGLSLIDEEVAAVVSRENELADDLDALADHLTQGSGESADQLAEQLWTVFFPEGKGIRGHELERAAELRSGRTIEVTAANPAPLTDPAGQVLFTANALLTIPPSHRRIDDLDLEDEVRNQLRSATEEPQLFWYDHPIQIGVEPSGSELLYGLRGLEQGVVFEKDRGTAKADARLTVVLSVSVTHESLEQIARRYITDEVRKIGGLDHVELYAFTETDTARLIADVLAPAAEAFLDRSDAAELLDVFGVHGRYGRHHSFLKAVAALWQVTVDPAVTATTKTDLDHTWPQESLVAETGRSLLEHFRFPLWGGTGVDQDGQALDLGAMAGALVNEADIHRGLFTPDVPFPNRTLEPDEFVFFSGLTQALSTAGEAGTRYGPTGLDGSSRALERVHVHGGTAGMLIESLRRHRPFTPSFIARAEDQAFVLSLFGEPEPRLAYVHNDTLIQRHDKKGFAGEAIEASRIPTMIGDYIRILLFSELADVLTNDRQGLKAVADPFTGCFISRIPVTVTYLRFALKAAAMFARGDRDDGEELVISGAERLLPTLAFVAGRPSQLEVRYGFERQGWDLFYETLDVLENRLRRGDRLAKDFAERSQHLVRQCAIS